MALYKYALDYVSELLKHEMIQTLKSYENVITTVLESKLKQKGDLLQYISYRLFYSWEIRSVDQNLPSFKTL